MLQESADLPEIPMAEGLDAAIGWLRERLGSLEVSGRARTIGITGPVGGGKSTLAARTGEVIGAAATVVVTTDRYLPDYHAIEEGTEDRPESSDLARLALDIERLAIGETTPLPVWSFHEHRRTGEEAAGPVPADGAVIVEGLHALHAAVRPMLDIAVYVHASKDTRRARWDAIAERGERGWDVERSRAFFDATADPTYAEFADLYRATADLIVINA